MPEKRRLNSENISENKKRRIWSVRRFLAHYVAFFAVLTVLNALFWFTADFGSFSPPSAGSFLERLWFFGLTASGPIACLHVGMVGMFLVVIAFCAGALFLGIKFRNKLIFRIVTYFSIFVWFVLGFCVSGLRIT
ncbi:MAG: hypothetical protein ACYS6W_00455 [Planctomycetota bacterium]|jgi:hypothetical protein